MDNVVLVNGVTSQQLTETILKGVKEQLDELKKDFKPKEPTEYLTRKEVAKILKISLVTVHEWAKNGILKPYKMGNRTYFIRKEIEDSMVLSVQKPNDPLTMEGIDKVIDLLG